MPEDPAMYEKIMEWKEDNRPPPNRRHTLTITNVIAGLQINTIDGEVAQTVP